MNNTNILTVALSLVAIGPIGMVGSGCGSDEENTQQQHAVPGSGMIATPGVTTIPVNSYYNPTTGTYTPCPYYATQSGNTCAVNGAIPYPANYNNNNGCQYPGSVYGTCIYPGTNSQPNYSNGNCYRTYLGPYYNYQEGYVCYFTAGAPIQGTYWNNYGWANMSYAQNYWQQNYYQNYYYWQQIYWQQLMGR